MNQVPDDILIQFEAEAKKDGNWDWDDGAHKCGECGIRFAVGDLTIIHGDLTVAPANRETRCVDCGYRKITTSGVAPSGMSVFIEQRYKGKLLSELPQGVADRIRGAILTIVEVEGQLSRLMSIYQSAISGASNGKGGPS